MKTYAHVQDGRVVEIILPMVYEFDADDESYKAGDEIPINQRFTPEFVATLVDISEVSPQPTVGMAYDGTTFSDYVPPPLSDAQILAANTAMRDLLLAQAAAAIAPLQDAVDLEEATDAEVALLKQWKQYRVAVNRIDLAHGNPIWPVAPTA